MSHHLATRMADFLYVADELDLLIDEGAELPAEFQQQAADALQRLTRATRRLVRRVEQAVNVLAVERNTHPRGGRPTTLGIPARDLRGVGKD